MEWGPPDEGQGSGGPEGRWREEFCSQALPPWGQCGPAHGRILFKDMVTSNHQQVPENAMLASAHAVPSCRTPFLLLPRGDSSGVPSPSTPSPQLTAWIIVWATVWDCPPAHQSGAPQGQGLGLSTWALGSLCSPEHPTGHGVCCWMGGRRLALSQGPSPGLLGSTPCVLQARNPHTHIHGFLVER